MKFLLVYFVTIIWIAAVEAQGETNVALTQVQEGIRAAEETLNVLDSISSMRNSRSFSQIGRIAQHVTPFLGAIGPFISIISTFTVSPEIALMKRKFTNIDRQFGQVFNRLSRIETEVKESALRSHYHVYEQNIINLSNRMNRFIRTNSNYYKNVFIRKYEDLYRDSATYLLHGMIRRYSVAYNIPYKTMQVTENHRRRTQKFMNEVVKLIIQGSRIELTYTALKRNESDYLRKKNDWSRNIRDLLNHVQRMSVEVKSRWYSELERNIDTALEENSWKSHSKFGSDLYKYLADKFDWRDWHVVAYNDVRGTEPHWVKSCGGYIRFRKHGRNLVVASVDDRKDAINEAYAERKMRSMTTKKDGFGFWGAAPKVPRDAKDIFYNEFPWEFRSGCKYAAIGVIRTYAFDYAIGVGRRSVFVENGDFHLYAFG